MKLTHGQKWRTKREAEKERRLLARSLRQADRERLKKLRQALKVARKARREAMSAAVEFCREGRRLVRERARERRLRAMAELKSAREAEALAARRACLAKKDGVRQKSAPTIADAEKALAEARATRRELEAAERSGRERERGRKRASSAERRAESDDAVRADLPAELVPVFDKVRRSIKSSARMSRAEVFLKWAEDNPGEVLAIQNANAEDAVAELIRERTETERKLRSRKRYRRSTEELAEDLRKKKKDEEVPF
jgi:hypothetical protein